MIVVLCYSRGVRKEAYLFNFHSVNCWFLVDMETVCGLRVTEVTKALASDTSHQLLIIDCRSFMAFNQGHILESVNIHCPPILKRRSGGFIALEHIVPCEGKRSQLLRGLVSNVVVYDENTQELGQVAGDSNLLSVIQSLLKQVDRLTVRFIIGKWCSSFIHSFMFHSLTTFFHLLQC